MDTALWKRKATVLRSGLGCPDCGKGVSLISGQQVLTFHCPLGHSWELRELLERRPGAVVGLHRILVAWREKLQSLESTIQRATESGFPGVAETFRHEFRRLQSRVALVERGIANAS